MLIPDLSAVFALTLDYKCGEITLLSDNFKDLRLHCIFCGETTDELSTFGDHLEKHKQLLIDVKDEDERQFDEEGEQEFLAYVTKNHIKNETNEVDRSNEMLEDNFLTSQTGADVKDEVYTKQEVFNEGIKLPDENEISEYEEETFVTEYLNEDEMNTNSEAEEDSPCYASTNSQASKEETVIAPKTIVKETTQSFLLQLIKEIRKQTVLWNDQHKDYSRKIARSNAFYSITEVLKQAFPNKKITKELVRRKIARMLVACTAVANGKLPEERVAYYRYMSFLPSTITKNKSIKLQRNAEGFYECLECSKQFTNSSNATLHMRIHRKDYSCQCEICHKQFYFPNQLQRHMLIHTNEKPFVCEICGRDFRMHNDLTRHLKKHNEQHDFKCTHCSKAFYRRELLHAHINRHEQSPKLICDICGKSFYRKSNLRDHKKLHQNVKQYKCLVCDRTFSQFSGRYTHMRVHNMVQESKEQLLNKNLFT